MNTSKLTQIIFEALKKQFSDIKWVIYPQFEKINKYQTPFGALELRSINHLTGVADMNNVELAMSVRLVYDDYRNNNLSIRDKALAIGCFLDGNVSLDKDISNISIYSNQYDNFSPVMDGYLVWEIEFSVKLVIGESIYQENGVSPELSIEVIENAD